MKTGVACGRFQILHNEHLNYILAAKEKCEHLIVGITSPDSSVSPQERADENRGKAESNPCTYYERMKMIERVLIEVGISREEFDIVPFPIGKPELLKFYIPKDAHIYVTILDEWGYCKKNRLQEFGYEVEVLWENKKKLISSTMIRKNIIEGKEWEQFVPRATYQYVREKKIDRRIRSNWANKITIKEN